MTTYALVHGAWHAAWHWHPLEAQLRSRGHQTIAVDLPCQDPAAGASEYADVVVRALAGVDDDVVVVGHSLGGLTIPVVAARRPVRHLVFLAALLPDPGRSLDEQRTNPGDEPVMLAAAPSDGQIDHEDGSTSWQADAAVAFFYPDSPPELAGAAARRLRRQCWRTTQETTPLRAWPAVCSTYILCASDAALQPAWSRVAARTRLGVTAIELPGDHSPFLARPHELADLLDRPGRG